MQKRTKLAIVILIGLLLIGLGLYVLLGPFFARVPSAQPPSLPNQVTQSGSRPVTTGSTPTSTTAAPTPTPAQVTLRALENQARTAVERIGSGVSTDGFRGYQDAMLTMTSSGKTQLAAQQQTMQKAHPATGPYYGISTQAVSSNTTSGAAGDAKIVVTVEAVQRVDTGTTTAAQPTGTRILVTFVRQSDGSYLIDSLVWSVVSL